jgi:hypothetical protein
MARRYFHDGSAEALQIDAALGGDPSPATPLVIPLVSRSGEELREETVGSDTCLVLYRDGEAVREAGGGFRRMLNEHEECFVRSALLAGQRSAEPSPEQPASPRPR